MNPVDALFVSPHPDDVEIFCGGTVAALAAAGRAVMIADLSAGELASNGTVEERRRDSLHAARRLGAVEERPVLGLPDGAIAPRDPMQLDAVVSLVRRVRPRVVFAPWPEDRHPDHEASGELVQRAVFLAGLARHEPARGAAHRVARTLFYPCHRDVPVHLLVDVSAHLQSWRDAVACYGSQFVRGATDVATPINRPGFLAAHEGRRAHWGNLGGVAHAEAFLHVGPWRVAAATDLLGDEGAR